MPEYVKGNHCWMLSTQKWNMLAAEVERSHGINLTETNLTPEQQFMFQPGILRGFNGYLGVNTSAQDIDIIFRKLVYNGVAGYSAPVDFIIKTIPAGEVGDFCAPKITNATELASRSWARWDQVGFTTKRLSGTGVVTNWSVGVCLEITEEVLFDTQNPPNRPLQP